MHIALGAFIDGLDFQALTSLHHLIGRSHAFDTLCAAGLNNSLLKFGPFAFAICWFWFDAHPDRERRRAELAQALLVAVGTLVLARVLALGLPFRLRPAYRVDLGLTYPAEIGLHTWSAFPSDHAVIAFALVVALARLSPRVGVWAFAHAALVICFPRVYFGLHHPSDVIGGALIGAVIAIVAAWMPMRWARSGGFTKLAHTRPALFYAFGFILLFEIVTMFDGLRSTISMVFGTLRQVSA